MIKLSQKEKELITRVLHHRKDEGWAEITGNLMAEMTFENVILNRHDLAVILGCIKDYCRDHEKTATSYWILHDKLEEIYELK